jgi:hypothetical protein
MRLVAFNVDELQFMFSGLVNQADRWRPRQRNNQPSSSVGETFFREFEALAKKIGTVLQQAEHSITTNIAITGQLPPESEVPDRGPPPQPPRLITLSVAELRTLWMAVMGEAGNMERALEREIRKGRKTKDEADYIRAERRRVKHCRMLAGQIDRLYQRARKMTAVNVALE